MKVMVGYPPIESPKGVPLLSQNRQFQYFNNPTFIYPVVPASAASLLQARGYDVAWADGIAERQTYAEFVQRMERERPDVFALETKTPTVKAYWRIIDDLKDERSTGTRAEGIRKQTEVTGEGQVRVLVPYPQTGGRSFP